MLLSGKRGWVRTATVVTAICVIFLVGTFVILKAKSQRKAQQRFNEALTPATVSISKDQAAVIKLTKGYVFVLCHITHDTSGSCKVIYSESGNFQEDSSLLREGPFRSGDTVIVNGRSLRLGGLGDFANISLDIDDEESAIAVYQGIDPAALELKKLSFRRKPALSEALVRDYLEKHDVLKAQPEP